MNNVSRSNNCQLSIVNCQFFRHSPLRMTYWGIFIYAGYARPGLIVDSNQERQAGKDE